MEYRTNSVKFSRISRTTTLKVILDNNWVINTHCLLALLCISLFVILTRDASATSSDKALLTLKFPGLSSVHAEVRVPDGKVGTATGMKVTQESWRNNEVTIDVPYGVYDVKLLKGATVFVVDNVDCSSGNRTIDGLTSKLIVNFPGLSSIHTNVQVSDGVEGSTSGKEVTYSNWKMDKAEITVFRQKYDLKIQKGGATFIVDDVDCRSGTCNVTGISSTLTVNFPEMSSVRTNVLVSDGIDGMASGAEVTDSSWKNDQAVISVLPQIYDLKIQKGSAIHIVDNVDCTSGVCTVDGIAVPMNINFPGLSSVHTFVLLPDDKEGAALGNAVTQSNWKNDQTTISVFPQKFDLKLQKGSAFHIVDNVDCSSGTCTVNGLSATLSVEFPGLSSVHTAVLLPDGEEGRATGNGVAASTWKENRTELAVFPQTYDLKIEKGSTTYIVDDVDCTSGTCVVDDIAATMTVNFPGLSSVHTAVLVPDGEVGSVFGDAVISSNWKEESVVIPVLRQIYDVEIRKSTATRIVDNVDCTSGECLVDGLSAVMTINFPGISSVHSSIMLPDGADGIVSGEKVTDANWKNDQAMVNVLAQKYDVKIEKGSAVYVVDDLDCSSGTCLVDEITAILTVDFPGQSSVHTDVLIPDGVNGQALGGEMTHANWKSQRTMISVFRQKYDITVDHDEVTVFDEVDCTSGNCNLMIMGNAQVSLVDGDNNLPLPELQIRAYERLENGKLESRQKRTTNDNGVAHFNLEGLASGKTYVLRLDNPFGNEKRYYSPFLTREGPIEFRITREGEYPLDLINPAVTITLPVSGHGVSETGFEVQGNATDNNEIEAVVLHINDPVKGESIIPAQYNRENNSWSAKVTSAMISENPNVVLTAIALDRAHNQDTATITVSAIVDRSGPQISISSHTNNDEVSVTGFLLTGSIEDDTLAQSLFVTLEDPVKGVTIDNQALEFSAASGAWTLVVLNGLTTEGQKVTIRLAATDVVGNSGSTSIDLNVVEVNNLARQMINRITFGATPKLLREVKNLDAIEFLDQQLDPNSVDDSEFEAMLDGFQPNNDDELKAYSMLHMIHSKRQLREVMTWFWDNHFSTDITKEGNQVSYELRENQQFRANALGNFRDLLEFSAKSPAMLFYLDSVQNTASDSNENYAREILELHTMGVDGGYTSDDIEAGAEIFTGWGVQNNSFFFNAGMHNFDPQVFLGETISGGGVEQGELLMDVVVAHRSTAEFICKKLVTVFVSDNPPDSLVQRVANIFQIALNDDDQIAQVVRAIINSPEFTANYRDKIKSPLEFVVGFARNLSAETNGFDLAFALEPLGMSLYENPLPTGWSEKGNDWINSNLLLERIKWVNGIANNSPLEDETFIDPAVFFSSNGFETAEGIVGFLLEVAFGDDFTELNRSTALGVLNAGEPFLMSSADSDQKLRNLVGTVLSYPGYQFQ